jgi:uracil-DNA glycosylase
LNLNPPKKWSSYIDYEELENIKTTLEKDSKEWHPKAVFRALELTDPGNLKAVLLGLDPYPTRGVPNGLAFSVNPEIKPLPASLRNIFKEYVDDLGYPEPSTGDLTPWAKQVLLINTALTCNIGETASHDKLWKGFTRHLLEEIAQRHNSLVFILLGNNAKERIKGIDLSEHHVITSPHPSPLSAYRGFFGSKIFSKTNQALEEDNSSAINWRLE